MQFLDINGVRRFKQYTDDTFITSEEVSEVEEATLENFYTKTEIDNIVSDLEDEIQSGGGSGGGTITETDPTVPAWAKASSKPTYTASEVGALPDTTVIPAAPGTLITNATTAQTASSGEAMSGIIALHKIAKTGTYSDLIGTPTIPTKVSDLTNDSNFTSNTGTVTGVKINGTIKTPTSGTVDLGTVLASYTETDPVFTASAAHGISSTDISNWNAKQKAITISSSEPTSSDGNNGDIWIVI